MESEEQESPAKEMDERASNNSSISTPKVVCLPSGLISLLFSSSFFPF